MMVFPRRYIPWVVAAAGTMLLPAWLVYQGHKTRDVSFLLFIEAGETADRITQRLIDVYLGTGYKVIHADVIEGRNGGGLKLVTLRVPSEMAATDVGAKLERVPGVTKVLIPERVFSSLAQYRTMIDEAEKSAIEEGP